MKSYITIMKSKVSLQISVDSNTLSEFNRVYYKYKKIRNLKNREEFLKDMLVIYDNTIISTVVKY
jgi:hypothetical protein